MKRFIAMALAATMILVMAAGLTACGGKSVKSGGTLTWIQLGDKQAKSDEILAKANEIIEPELGLKLDIQYIDTASFKDKSKLKMASGEDFDLMWAGYLNNYQAAVSLGGLLDITDYLDNIKMADGSTVKMSNAVERYFLDAATVDGRIYGVPNMQVVSNPFSYKVRKAIVDKCGIDMAGMQELALKVKDLDSAKAYMEKLTKEMQKAKDKRPDVYTTIPGTNPAARNVYEEIIGGVGIRKDGTSNKVVIINDTDEFKCGIDTAREWFEKGFIRSDIASKGNATTSTDEEKQYAFVMTSWKPGQDAQEAADYGEALDFSFLEEPYVSRTSPLATMLAVGKDSKHPKEAVKLMYMLNTNKELYNLLCWGIEGENYKKSTDGTITEMKNTGYDDVGSNAWRYGNQFNSFIIAGQSPTVWDETRKMNDNARKSPAMGFVPDTDPITTEIANITNVNSEYKAKIEFGTSPRSEYWDEYMSKLKEAGIEKVCDEIQKQYDKFLASK